MALRDAPFRSTSIAISTAAPALASLLIAACSTVAMATEGYLQNGIGARNKALAGAGVAYGTDATAASLNPAGIINAGNQINISASILSLDGGYNSNGTGGLTADGAYDSNKRWVGIPNFAASWRVNWGLVDSVAVTAYGNGGVATRYGNFANPNGACGGGTGVYCGGVMGLELTQTMVSVAFAKQLAPGFSVGVAPIVARQVVEVDGVGAFTAFSSDPANFTNRGKSDSWGVGVRGGVEWQATPWLRFGVAGNSAMSMDKFEEYRGLFADRGGADIPATIQAGIAVNVHPNMTLMLDYKHIWFNNNPAVANPSTNFNILAPAAAPFGAPNGAGFGLQDVDTIKVGLEWRQAKDLTWRWGYSYNTAPLKSRDADLNIMTLGVVQHHITSGVKYSLTENFDLEIATMYAPRATLSGVELGFPTRNVEIELSQFEFTVGATYRFGR